MVTELPQRCQGLIGLQHGVLSRSQALSLGVGPNLIGTRLRSGRWQPLYHGIYATFTGEPGREAKLWAALLRVGQCAVLSHYSAAELDGLTDRMRDAIHVTVPRSQHPRRTAGIVIHRSDRVWAAYHPSRMPPRTRIEETVLDLAEDAATLDEAFGWLMRACGKRLTTQDRLRAAMAARARMRWRGELAIALSDIGEGVHSVLEYRYVRNAERAHGLPRAERQALVILGGQRRYLDNLYRPYGVAAELDGRASHPIEERWRDIRRDNAAAEAGIEVLRYNGADVTQRPCQVAAQLASVLSQHGWRPTLRRCGPTCTVWT